MPRFEDLEAFANVVDLRSLTAAAKYLDRSLQSVSRSLAVLESEVGTQLVHRTTRHCRPTEAGFAYYARIKPALEEIKDATLATSSQRSEPSGILRVSAPVLFGPGFVVPIIAKFMKRHPQVQCELILSDHFVDLATENFDLAVRIGELANSSLKARRLGALRRVVFGSPEYFRKFGRPQHPSELKHHRCIVRTMDERRGEWAFMIDRRPRMVKVEGTFRASAMPAIYAAVAEGLGLGYSPLWQIRHLIDAGIVETVLTDFEPPPVAINAVWPGGSAPSAKLRAFIDLLASDLDLRSL